MTKYADLPSPHMSPDVIPEPCPRVVLRCGATSLAQLKKFWLVSFVIVLIASMAKQAVVVAALHIKISEMPFDIMIADALVGLEGAKLLWCLVLVVLPGWTLPRLSALRV